MKKYINKFLYPNRFLGCLIFNISFIYLFCVFKYNLNSTVLAYPSYALSAYALLIFCICFYKTLFNINKKINNNKYYITYKENKPLQAKISLYASLVLNLIYGVFNFFTGIYYKSAWFLTFAVYYLLLFFMRFLLVKTVKNGNKEKEYKKLKLCGFILLLLDIVFSGMIVLIINKNQFFEFQGYLIYVVALYNFYLVISAFINVFRYWKSYNPLLLANKCINLTVAMISILSLEVAMLIQFGENESENFNHIMIMCTGLGICVINSFMSIYMVVKANKNLNH